MSECSTESNTNSSTEKCNSDEGDDHRDSSQSTTPSSSLEANAATDTSSLSTFKDSSIKSSEGANKSSYAMDDILRIDSQSASAQVRVNDGTSEVKEVESRRSTADEIMKFICSLGKHSVTEQEVMRKEIAKLLKNIEKPKENTDKKEAPFGESNKSSNEDKLKRCGPQTNIAMTSPVFSPSIPREMFGLLYPPSQDLTDSLEALFLKPLPNTFPYSSDVNEKCKQKPLAFLLPNVGSPVEPTTANQTEALSLVVDKDSSNHPSLLDSSQGFENSLISQRKKRTKVTDTRLSPQKMPSSSGIFPTGVEDSLFAKYMLGCSFNPSPKFMEYLKNLLPLTLPSLSNTAERPSFFNKTLPTTNPFLPFFQPPPFLSGTPQFPLPHPLCPDTSPIPTPCSSGLSEPAPIRRNRSIGSRRVTNTASILNYGGDARPYRIPTSITDDGSTRLHSSIAAHPLPLTTTLTPVHLRKAKLMFFYTRYPNSNLLRSYFIDVEFQKHNTAQLVKWFSNFREFYYITIDKTARQAISQGIRDPLELAVTTESEIFRTLVQHYNRNQQIEVPDEFRVVVERTLREFFMAILAGKDAEQSWKKPIYKIIARMDQPIPEFFRDPAWISQLSAEA
ncbi:unnamed protein product [Hymenolepis diminuta]|nr:unnamed protein product [Hymenolepis diminuta]